MDWGKEDGRRLKAAIGQAGKTQESVAGASENFSIATLKRWVAGTASPSDDALAEIAIHLGVSVARLTGGHSDDVIAIPAYTTRVAAGAGQVSDDGVGPPAFQWTFPKDWFEANIRAKPKDLRIFTVHGSSQEPELSSGDLVAVDTSSRKLYNDGMYVLAIEDELVVKRVQKVGSVIKLLSRNDANPTLEIDLSVDGDRLVVIGEAIWASKML